MYFFPGLFILYIVGQIHLPPFKMDPVNSAGAFGDRKSSGKQNVYYYLHFDKFEVGIGTYINYLQYPRRTT